MLSPRLRMQQSCWDAFAPQLFLHFTLSCVCLQDCPTVRKCCSFLQLAHPPSALISLGAFNLASLQPFGRWLAFECFVSRIHILSFWSRLLHMAIGCCVALALVGMTRATGLQCLFPFNITGVHSGCSNPLFAFVFATFAPSSGPQPACLNCLVECLPY